MLKTVISDRSQIVRVYMVPWSDFRPVWVIRVGSATGISETGMRWLFRPASCRQKQAFAWCDLKSHLSEFVPTSCNQGLMNFLSCSWTSRGVARIFTRFLPPVVGCLLKTWLTKRGGHGHPPCLRPWLVTCTSQLVRFSIFQTRPWVSPVDISSHLSVAVYCAENWKLLLARTLLRFFLRVFKKLHNR